jgi:hypothetical protein
MSANSRVGWGKGYDLRLALRALESTLSSGLTVAGHHLRADASITRGGVDAAVAEQNLDDTDIGAVLQKMCGEGMAESMNGDSLANTGPRSRFPTGQL